jgi:ABC-type Fe3+-hydroxamate transport system substrate-binding protein
VYQLNDASPLGKVAAAMGCPRCPRPRPPARRSTVLSLEQLSTLDGDLLLLLDFGGDGDGSAALRERSVFQALDVVRAGRVVEVTEDDAHALYFDSVLTVEPNARFLRRTLAAAV